MSRKYEDQTDLPPELHRAVIACHGQLTPKYKYIEELRRIKEKRSYCLSIMHVNDVYYFSLGRFLVLGAGFVSGSAVDYLCRNPKHYVTVGKHLFLFFFLIANYSADISLQQAQKLIEGKPNCHATTLDVSNSKELDELVSKHNIVIWFEI
jgi:hypothetical protein